MAEVLMISKAKYTQYLKVDGDPADEELAGHGPNAVAHLLKLFANATDDGELTLEVDGGAEHGVAYLVRKNGLLFTRSRNLDEPEAADKRTPAPLPYFGVCSEFVESARRALLAKMKEISGRHCNAQWADGIEYELWGAVIGVAIVLCPQKDVEELKRFSDVAGGWFCYKKKEGIVFMSSDEWHHAYSHRERT